MSVPALELSQVSKAFPGVQALDDVSLVLQRGEVHALAGENGAGKSSLIKVMAGAYRPDRGVMKLDGQEYRPRAPLDAMRSGIRVVHQELLMLDELSVAENLLFDDLPRRALGWVDRGRLRARARELLAMVGLDGLDPDRRVSGLGMAQRQLIEIGKALAGECRILVLDEPTATLTTRETERLFDIVRRLRSEGVAVLFVSHHLQEIFEICDQVSVMRNGRHVRTCAIRETSPDDLVKMMVGRSLPPAEQAARQATSMPPHAPNPDQGEGPGPGPGSGPGPRVGPGPGASGPKRAPALQVKGLRFVGQPEGASIDLQVARGEIVGLAGLVGSGRTETVRAIFGADPRVAGTVLRDGREVDIRAPRDAIVNGICLATEDRKDEGLILDMPIRANVTLATLAEHSRAGWIDHAAERRSANEQVRALDIRSSGIEQEPRKLSGGNQQKVVLAKWLQRKPEVLLLDEPTRGVDVGAKAEIHALLRRAAQSGMALLIVSSDLPELLGACDRIVVLSRGRVTGELARDDFDEQRILALAYREYLQHEPAHLSDDVPAEPLSAA